MATNPAVRVPEAALESSASAVHWGAIIAGAIGAVGISFILISLGGALGHAAVSPWSPSGSAPTTFGRVAAIWLIVTQWLASGLGGYLAGRMREKWVGIRTDEVVFRDTAHGFLAWALAVLIVVALLTLGSIGVGATAASTSTGAVSPEAAEVARKAAGGFAFYSALSLLIGAFIASVAGALGGFHRDEM
jgi:hypothetical protein